MILVSACLAGVCCRYDGKSNENEKIVELCKQGKAIPVCPEQMGGLCTPRDSAEIKMIKGQKRILTQTGQDVTDLFEKGAEETLEFAQKLGMTKAILQDRSPSCGCGKIYDGNFNRVLIQGNGITTQLLLDHGIEAISLSEYLEEVVGGK